MNEQERYYPVVIKCLRDATPQDYRLGHDAIDAVETYCFALPGSTRKRRAAALRAIDTLKSDSISLCEGYYSALPWLLDETAADYDTIRYKLKDYYKLSWDTALETKCRGVDVRNRVVELLLENKMFSVVVSPQLRENK